MIVIDTGPIIANANRKDNDHQRCADLLQNFPGPLLLPQPLLTEIGYMLASRAGAKARGRLCVTWQRASTSWWPSAQPS